MWFPSTSQLIASTVKREGKRGQGEKRRGEGREEEGIEGKGIITCIGGMITWQPCLLLDNDRLYCRSVNAKRIQTLQAVNSSWPGDKSLEFGSVIQSRLQRRYIIVSGNRQNPPRTKSRRTNPFLSDTPRIKSSLYDKALSPTMLIVVLTSV